MTPTAEQIHAGHAAFTRTTLTVYDQLILGLTCRLIWRCSTERILQLYGHYLSGNHLEVGVGTGFFLDHSRFPIQIPRVALLDLNSSCLEHTTRRLGRYSPEVYQANELGSIRMGLLLLCNITWNTCESKRLAASRCFPAAYQSDRKMEAIG